MAAASTITIGSIFEVLTGDNYERWSVLMKNYLRAEGLWDIVSRDNMEEYPDIWERKNAKALYAIQLSCGPRYFKLIRRNNNARNAWIYLNTVASPDLEAKLDHDLDIMAAASASSSGSDFELLAGNNYERWSDLMENYLRAKGLWDIISGDDIDEYSDIWKRRHAQALYAIQLSCGPDYFKKISRFGLASFASSCLSRESEIHSSTPILF